MKTKIQLKKQRTLKKCISTCIICSFRYEYWTKLFNCYKANFILISETYINWDLAKIGKQYMYINKEKNTNAILLNLIPSSLCETNFLNACTRYLQGSVLQSHMTYRNLQLKWKHTDNILILTNPITATSFNTQYHTHHNVTKLVIQVIHGQWLC